MYTDRQADRSITNTDITVDICTLIDKQINLLHRHCSRQMYTDRQTDRSITNTDITVDICTLTDRQIDLLQTQTLQKIDVH